MGNFENIQSFLQAPSEGASPSPIGDFPTLRNLYSSSYALGKPGLREATGFAKEQVDYEDKLRAAAEKKAKDKAEGVGFERVPKDDGGYDFFDNEGKPITAQEFARAKKMRLEDVLEGSYHPQDIGYLNDASTAKYISAAANALSRVGSEKIAEYRAKQQKEEELTDEEQEILDYKDNLEKITTENPGVSDLTQQQLIQNLIKSYPSLFQRQEEQKPQSQNYKYGLGYIFGKPGKG